jgi:hypothetical protein
VLDSRTAWFRRLGTLSGLALVAFGLYLALLYSPHHCPPSTPHHQYACDVGSPGHPHFVLGLLISVVGLAALAGSRRFFAYFDNE